MSDAAANLMIAARDAIESYEGLRNNTNTSNTTLAQSQVAGTVTQGSPDQGSSSVSAPVASKSLGVGLNCCCERTPGDAARSKNCYRDEVGSGSKR